MLVPYELFDQVSCMVLSGDMIYLSVPPRYNLLVKPYSEAVYLLLLMHTLHFHEICVS